MVESYPVEDEPQAVREFLGWLRDHDRCRIVHNSKFDLSVMTEATTKDYDFPRIVRQAQNADCLWLGYNKEMGSLTFQKPAAQDADITFPAEEGES